MGGEFLEKTRLFERVKNFCMSQVRTATTTTTTTNNNNTAKLHPPHASCLSCQRLPSTTLPTPQPQPRAMAAQHPSSPCSPPCPPPSPPPLPPPPPPPPPPPVPPPPALQGFEKDFEDFAERHHEHFMDAIDMVQGDEHKLEHHNIYNQYLEEFEGKIAACIEKEGGSVHDFYEEAQRIIESDDMSTNKVGARSTLPPTPKAITTHYLHRGLARHDGLRCLNDPHERGGPQIQDMTGRSPKFPPARARAPRAARRAEGAVAGWHAGGPPFLSACIVAQSFSHATSERHVVLWRFFFGRCACLPAQSPAPGPHKDRV